MNEKGELIMGETDTGQSPISSVPIDARIIPVPESHVDAGTVPIPESCIETRTVHIHASMPIGVQTPQKGDGPTITLWMP